MTLVADTGGLYALFDADDKHHSAVRNFLESYPGEVVVPLPVVAEVDYFLVQYLGVQASLDFLENLLSGVFTLDYLDGVDIARCRDLIKRYEDLALGFVDAAVLSVAERLGTTTILTIDLRDFRAVGQNAHGPLALLPADAS